MYSTIAVYMSDACTPALASGASYAYTAVGEGFFPSQFRLLRKSGFFPSQFRLISQLHDIYYNFFLFFFGTKPAWRRSSPNA